jgi:hypothetical protein
MQTAPNTPKQEWIEGVIAVRVSNATVELIAHAPPAVTWDVATLTSPTWFYPKYGLLPAVIDVCAQSGAWNEVAKTRTLVLGDGGSVVETITDVTPLEFFGYNLTEFQGLFGMLVAGARAEWDFWEQDGGTGIRWSYSFTARPGAGFAVSLIVRLFWARYMARVLPVIVREAERQNCPVSH